MKAAETLIAWNGADYRPSFREMEPFTRPTLSADAPRAISGLILCGATLFSGLVRLPSWRVARGENRSSARVDRR